jgi:hypothetical protein
MADIEPEKTDNLDDYLTDKEKRKIEELNKLSNSIDMNEKKLLDLSLRELLINWSNSMQSILLDISRKIDINAIIKKSDNLYHFLNLLITIIWEIISVENRLIYFGITILFISLTLYFINISSILKLFKLLKFNLQLRYLYSKLPCRKITKISQLKMKFKYFK